jgi:hypothetical protein
MNLKSHSRHPRLSKESLGHSTKGRCTVASPAVVGRTELVVVGLSSAMYTRSIHILNRPFMCRHRSIKSHELHFCS